MQRFDIQTFKEQYLAVMLSDLPIDLIEELTEDFSQWVYWEVSQLEGFNLSSKQIQFLSKIGLPKTSNDIYCEQYDDKTIALILDNHGLDNSYFPLGLDGCGSVVFLRIDNDCLSLCDHDNDNEMIFINSSLEKLAQTLVFVANVFIKENIANPLAELGRIDEKAVKENSFWYSTLKNR